MRAAFLFFILAAGLAPARASAQGSEQADQIVAPALEAAFAGDLRGAALRLEALAGADDADLLVLWNLAAVHARLDHLGPALHNVLRILHRRPGGAFESKAEALRDRVRLRLVEGARRAGNPDLFVLRDPRSGLQRFGGFAPEGAWRWWALFAFWALVLALAARGMASGAWLRRALTLGALLALLVVFVAEIGRFGAAQTQGGVGFAVTLRGDAPLKESLVSGAPVRKLPEGVVVEVEEMLTERMWKVRLPDGREGYAKARDLGLIR